MKFSISPTWPLVLVFLLPVWCQTGRLYKQSYRLRALIQIGDPVEETTIETYEWHSVEQERSLYKFAFKDRDGAGMRSNKSRSRSRLDLPNSGSILVDKRNQLALVHDGKTGCHQVSIESLGLGSLKSLLAIQMVTGAGRLLEIIESKKRQMLEMKPTELSSVNDMPTRGYSWDEFASDPERLDSLGSAWVAFAHGAEVDQPQVWPVRFRAHSHLLTVTFGQVELVEPMAELYEQKHLFLESEHEIVLDLMNTLNLDGCDSLVMKQNALEAIPEETNNPNGIRFSFTARHSYLEVATESESETPEVESVVTYDGLLSSLRVDRRPLEGSTWAGRKEIYNFRMNQMHSVAMMEGGEEEEEEDDDRKTGDYSQGVRCLSRQIEPNGLVNVWTPAQVLYGIRAWASTGRSQVRGVESLSFQAELRRPPFWLDHAHPLLDAHSSSNSTSDQQVDREPLEMAGFSLTLVVHLSADDERRPLAMEFIRNFRQNPTDRRRMVVQLHQFRWHPGVETTSRRQPNDVFSLAGECQVGEEPEGAVSRTASIRLLLAPGSASGKADSRSIRASPAIRDQATRDATLLAGLQAAFRLPVSLISHLHSNLIDSPRRTIERTQPEVDASTTNEGPKISLSFRLSQHPNRLVHLTRLGIGEGVFVAPEVSEHRSLRRLSFASCFWEAAHRGFEGPFWYQARSGTCWMTMVPLEQPNQVSLVTTVANQKEGDIEREAKHELYWISYASGSGLADSRWLVEHGWSLRESLLTGHWIPLFGIRADERALRMNVVKVQVDELDLHPTGPPRSISGWSFALDQTGTWPLSRHLESPQVPSPAGEGDDTEPEVGGRMSVEQCRTDCLADVDCKSFSICLRSGRVECVGSRVGLDLFWDQLPVGVTKLKPNQRIELEMKSELKKGEDYQEEETGDKNNSKLSLIYRPSCDIHQKIYLNLFQGPQLWIARVDGGHLERVAGGVEECGRKCFERNLAALREDSRLKDRLDGELRKPEVGEDPNKLMDLVTNLHLLTNEFCRTFLYQSELISVDSSGGWTTPDRKSEEQSIDSLGWCYINHHEDPSRSSLQNETALFRWHRYHFDPSLMFERQAGFRLASSHSDEQTNVDLQMVRSSHQGDDQIDRLLRLRRLIEGGHNIQEVSGDSAWSCAARCFFRHRLPACRSFDVAIRADGQTGRHSTYCYLNTIILVEAKSNGLLITRDHQKRLDKNSSQDRDILLVHYEPRHESLIADEISLKNQLDWTAAEQVSREFVVTNTRSLWHWMIGFMSLVAGTVIGMNLGLNIATKLNQVERENSDSERDLTTNIALEEVIGSTE